MRKWIAAYLLIFATLLVPWQSFAGRMTLTGAGGVAAGGGCAEATAAITRMNATGGGQNTTAVTNLICGMVTDGTWAIMDLFYIFATNSSANALLNWVSTSGNLSTGGSPTPTFTANQGFSQPSGGGFLNTPSYNVSTAGGHYTLNSASLGDCDLASHTASNQQWIAMNDGTNLGYLYASATNTMTYDVNDVGFITAGFTNFQGQWVTTRTASNLVSLYKNGSLVTSNAKVSSAVPNTFPGFFGSSSSAVLASGFLGGGLTLTQVGLIGSRLSTYFAAVGASGC